MDENKKPKIRRAHRSAEEIASLLESFESSGLTQQKYCLERGLSVATFSSWRRKAANGKSSTEAVLRPVRVRVTPPELSAAGPMVRFPDGVEVFLPHGSCASAIAALVKALRSDQSC